jgi:hypothetical protein
MEKLQVKVPSFFSQSSDVGLCTYRFLIIQEEIVKCTHDVTDLARSMEVHF